MYSIILYIKQGCINLYLFTVPNNSCRLWADLNLDGIADINKNWSKTCPFCTL